MSKRISLAVLALVCLVTAVTHAQTIGRVSAVIPAAVELTAANAACNADNCVSVEMGGYKSVSVQTEGTCGTCTLQFEVSNGTTWVAANMYPISGTQTAATSTTTAGVWRAIDLPVARFRVRMSALSSGSFTVRLRVTQ